jgi:hypothetical protein
LVWAVGLRKKFKKRLTNKSQCAIIITERNEREETTMKFFTADEAKARVAEYNAERDRIIQKHAEEIAEKAFDEIRERSANGGKCIALSICDIDLRNKVIELFKKAGYQITDDFSRVWIKWSE